MINLNDKYTETEIKSFLWMLESITRDKTSGKCLVNDFVVEISFTATPKDIYDNLQNYFKEKENSK